MIKIFGETKIEFDEIKQGNILHIRTCYYFDTKEYVEIYCLAYRVNLYQNPEEIAIIQISDDTYNNLSCRMTLSRQEFEDDNAFLHRVEMEFTGEALYAPIILL